MSKDKSPIQRVTRSKAQAKASYNQLSKYYDLMSGRFEKKYRDIGLEKLDVKNGEQVLEIGFGTGHGIQFMAEKVGQSGRVYGLDISEGMLAVTQKRISAAGLEARVELKLGDAVALPYESASMDAIFMSFTLELFDTPEIPLVLQECYRVLQAGGRICVLTIAKREKPNLTTRFYEWLHVKFPNAIDCRPIYAAEELGAAGFEIVEAITLAMFTIPVDIFVAKMI